MHDMRDGGVERSGPQSPRKPIAGGRGLYYWAGLAEAYVLA